MGRLKWTVSPERLNDIVSKVEPVQNDLERRAARKEAQAQSKLNAHRDTGKAKIRREKGWVDHYVILDDPNAMQIEFGHKGYEQERYSTKRGHYKIRVGPSKGLHLLTDE